MERLLEGVETAFQTFHHVGLVDGGKGIGDVFRHFAGGHFVGGTILHGAITRIAQAAAVEQLRIDFVEFGIRRVNQFLVGLHKQHEYLGRHLVGAVQGVEEFGEMNLVGIARLVLDVAAGAAHHHLFQNGMAQFLVDGVDAQGQRFGRQGAALRHQAFEFLNPRGEGVCDVAHAVEGATGGVLKEQQLVFDVFGRVVERCGRKEQHFLSARDVPFVVARRLGDALQQVVVAGAVVAEVVRFVNDDKVVVGGRVVVVAFDDFVQAAVADKAAVFVFDAEVAERLFPVAAHCGWEDDEDSGVVTVGGDEALGNHGGNHRLAQAHHVGDEASTVAEHDVVALHHGVALVGEVVVAFGQHGDEVVLHLSAEVVDEHTHIEFVGRGLLLLRSKVGAAHHPLHIGLGDGDGDVPKLLKLLLAVSHVVIILHGHVQFVARRVAGAEALLADVAAAHDDPAVAMLAVVLREAEVELGVKVFGGMDAHLQATAADVLAELPYAFVHLFAVVRLPHVVQEILAILLQGSLMVAEEHLAGGLRLTEHVVDIDAD